jgi:RNA polymerase sigma-70 factor (ECF subfamily)
MNENRSNPIPPVSRSSVSADAKRRAGIGSDAVSDNVLIEGVSAKDQGAMAAVFDRYAGLVYSIALRVLKDSASAEDVMQEIFFEVWKNPQSFAPGRGSLAGWLAVVARNRAIDLLRRSKPSDPVEEVVLLSQTDLSAEAERNILMGKIRATLLRLPSDQQYSLELAFFEGLSHSEIAAQTGIPLGTVKTRIRSALLSLREAVQT